MATATGRPPGEWWEPYDTASSASYVAGAMWLLALALPVWWVESKGGAANSGMTTTRILGIQALGTGCLGVLALCPAWYANLFLWSLHYTIWKGRKSQLALALCALGLACSSFMVHEIYLGPDMGAVVGRGTGFYLWLSSFVVLVLAHGWRRFALDPDDTRAA